MKEEEGGTRIGSVIATIGSRIAPRPAHLVARG